MAIYMWILNLKIKHDCTIGNKCEKYNVISHSIPLGSWKDKNYYYTSERHTLEGNSQNIQKFVQDIKKDKKVTNLETSKKTLFFTGKSKEMIPSSFYNQKMFFTKPVFVDKWGYEFWEVASYDKGVLSSFLKILRKQKYDYMEVLKFKNVQLDNIYFPSVAPNLTEKQKRAFELAVENGYYSIPKRTDLNKLAKLMKISIATYQEHLKRAEAKVIPNLTNF